MAFVDWPIEEQLRSLYRRAVRRRGAMVVSLDPPDGEVDGFRLASREVPVVVIEADLDVYLLSSAGVHRRRAMATEYLFGWEEVSEYYWISKDEAERGRLKRSHFDVLIVRTKDGREFTLAALAQAVFPLMSFVKRLPNAKRGSAA